MEKKREKAIHAFYNGNNCAQSVIKAYEDEFKLQQPQALDMALGFGGGMGKMQKTCGAVTGAYMLIGLHAARSISDQEQLNAEIPKLIQTFRKKFCQFHQTDQCIHLLGCDVRTEAGQATFKALNLKEKVCSKCIESSINILDEMFK